MLRLLFICALSVASLAAQSVGGGIGKASSGGGGGTPASPANSVQINNAGAFGGYGTIITTALSVPSAPTVANIGTAGSSDWTYKVSACTVVSCTAKSAAGSTSTGNATIDGTNFNRPSVVAVTGASSYRWYRTVAATDPTTLGYIGTTTLPTIDDTGLTGYGNDSPQGSSAGLMIPDTLRVNNSIFLGTADGAVNSDSLDMLIAGPNTESGFIGNAYELSFFGLNGTPNNPTKSNSGDLLGFIAFWARKSTGYSDGVNILAFADGDPDSGTPSPEDLCLGSFASGASPGSALDTRVSGNIDVLLDANSCYAHTPNLSFRNASGAFEINNGTPGTLATLSALTPFGTPANSSAACTQGQFKFDAGFFYGCTATNTWKRAALSAF